MSGFADNRELAVEAGRKGGQALARKVGGSDYYANIGRRGGEKIRERYGPDFFRAIGSKGGKAKHENAKAKAVDAEVTEESPE